MADINGTGRSPATRTNGSLGGNKARAGISSPKPAVGVSSPRTTVPRTSSLERRKSLPSKGNADAEAGLDSPLNPSASPLSLELNRLENELKVKASELDKVIADSKALKQLNLGKDKAIAGLRGDLEKLQEKHLATEKLLSDKILELKKANEQKKEAFSSQAAAEATIRRLQTAQKNSAMPSLETLVAPLEAQLKISHKEVAKLTEDNKAQERLMRLKESALVKTEQAVAAAQEKAAHVDSLLNLNRKLEKQLEAAQEETKTLDRIYKQKIEEVKKLTERHAALEEALTAAGGVSSTIKEYQRQVQDLQAELKATQEELARAKVAVNRVAGAVANEWKDDLDKVIPMHQWLEERRFLQGEAQGLREKLALAEKAVKFETQMKEKYQARLKVIEEGQRSPAGIRDPSRRFSTGGAFLGGAGSAATVREGAALESPSSSASGREAAEGSASAEEESVSEVLYNVLEKEVIALRRGAQEKDQTLKDKEDAIEMLSRRVEALSRSMEVDAKKWRRERSSMEKELSALKIEGTPEGKRRLSTPRVLSPASTPRSPVTTPRKTAAKSG